jgi:hypothetical protein
VLRQDGLWERLSSAIPPIQPASLNHPSMSSDADLWYLWHCLWAIRRPKPSQNLTYALQQMTMQRRLRVAADKARGLASPMGFVS